MPTVNPQLEGLVVHREVVRVPGLIRLVAGTGSLHIGGMWRAVVAEDDGQPAVGGEFIITLRLASGTDRGNGAAKRSDQGRHGRAAVRQIVLLECCH
jgi:hypothetical protein